jgi:hypothetical protein
MGVITVARLPADGELELQRPLDPEKFGFKLS